MSRGPGISTTIARRLCCGLSLGLVGALLLGSPAPAATPAPQPAIGETLRVEPQRVELRGPDAVQQLVVDAIDASGTATDATRSVRYISSEPRVATVDANGGITALADGNAVVTVQRGRLQARVAVCVVDASPGPPVHFANEVVPVLTKFGCNGGAATARPAVRTGFA